MIKEKKFYSISIDKEIWNILKDHLGDGYGIFPININYLYFLPLNIVDIENIEYDVEEDDKNIVNIIKSDFWKEAKKFLEENENCELFIGVNDDR